MSDASTGHDDRPAEVIDPLLWRLASAVADTHQPDEHGRCDNGSCFGADWPCAAWNSAQEGLRAAQGGPRTDGVEPTADQDSPDHASPAGPATPLPRPASRHTPPDQVPRSGPAPVEVTSAA